MGKGVFILKSFGNRQNFGHRLAATVAAGLAGAAVNLFTLDVFGGAPMTFGGIFPLATALQLGPWYGLLASLIAELPGVVHLHPLSIRPFYGLLTHVLEVVVVGWVARRKVARFMAPLVTDVLYWMLFGIPVLLFATHTRLDATPMWALVIKSLMNGMVDVTVADLLTALPGAAWIFAPSPAEAQPLRTHLSRGFLLATAVPFLDAERGHRLDPRGAPGNRSRGAYS